MTDVLRIESKTKTAKTALDDAVDHVRAVIARHDDEFVWEPLAKATNSVAYASGRYRVFSYTAEMLRNEGIVYDTMAAWLADTFLIRADDTWSGQTNDARRSYADGERDAASEILAALRVRTAINMSQER